MTHETVVLSVDGSAPSQEAVRWAAQVLPDDAHVIAVCGVSQMGEFALSLPPFEMGVDTVRDVFQEWWCRPLREAGLEYEPRLATGRQVEALLETVTSESPDLAVVGRQRWHGLADTALGKGFDRLVHHPPCPLVVVPPQSKTRLSHALVDVHGPEGPDAVIPWCEEHFRWGASPEFDLAASSAGPAEVARAAASGVDMVVVDPPHRLFRHHWVAELVNSAPCPVVVLPENEGLSRFWATMRRIAQTNPALSDPAVVPPGSPELESQEERKTS